MDETSIKTAVEQFEQVVPLVKAALVGGERVAPSNAIATDETERAFLGHGALPPPYDPVTLCLLLEHSNSLRQNIDAYATNIDAFGHRFEPVIDFDASDADQRIANAIEVERRRAGAGPGTRVASPTPEEVAERRAEVEGLMREERSRLENFFDHCCLDISFVTLRRRTRTDLELQGNAYWEVLRDGAGQIAQFVYLPAFTVRLLPLGPELVDVDHKVKVSDLVLDCVSVQRRFRRFVQLAETQTVFFKELGDPRAISRKTGRVAPSVEELLAADPSDGPATELLHFNIHSPRSPYGVPRWIGNLLAVLGSRQAEEINFMYFENKSVPPLAILVTGGRLSASSIPRIEEFIEQHIKGKRNFHRVLILEAEPAGSGGGAEHTGRMKIELRPLTAAQHSDALFQNYDLANQDKVGQSFRLPRMLRGDIRDFNRSCYSADTETLTESGWKRHDQIGARERIAVYEPGLDELRFEVPTSKHVAFVNETLYRFRTLHTDVLVTADHKMLARYRSKVWVQVSAAELARRTRFELRCAPERDHTGTELRAFELPKRCSNNERRHGHRPIAGDLWLEFLGYFVAAGGLEENTPYPVVVRQKRKRHRRRVRQCLDKIGWKYFSQLERRNGRFCVANACLRDWLAANCGGPGPDRHLPWEYVTGLPAPQLAVLLDAMMHISGARPDRGSNVFLTPSRVLADQVQIICTRLSMRAHMLLKPRAGVFRVCHAECQTTGLRHEDHVESVPYVGEVYCFSCPGAGFFVTRRNGCVAIQGNTADAALHFAESQVFEPERAEFDFNVNRKILTDMGIRYWRLVSKSPVNRDPATMAEIIRGLVNANVLTPEEGRQLAGEVFNREFRKISAAWVKQPVALTLAGMTTGDGDPSALVGPAVPTDQPARGALVAPTAAKRGSAATTTPAPDLVAEAERLIQMRDALRAAEAQAASKTFAQTSREELATDLVHVPAGEFASWFEPPAPEASQ